MEITRLRLGALQAEIKNQKILNQAYRRTLEREREEYLFLCKTEQYDRKELKARNKLIRVIIRDLSNRDDRIAELEEEKRTLKGEKVKQKSVWDILNITDKSPRKNY
ncbi:MAG: hypothetical protein JXB49_06000 [Bacteroidales bacterium]|nr:hypothetical protein [Bacteroidales bacterium]